MGFRICSWGIRRCDGGASIPSGLCTMTHISEKTIKCHVGPPPPDVPEVSSEDLTGTLLPLCCPQLCVTPQNSLTGSQLPSYGRKLGICGNGVRTRSTDATAQMYGLGRRAQLAAHQNIRRGLKEPAVGRWRGTLLGPFSFSFSNPLSPLPSSP